MLSSPIVYRTMSDDKIFFTFRNEVCLAMDYQHIRNGIRIHFDLDLTQLELKYQKSLLYLVDQNELGDETPVIEFAIRKQQEEVDEPASHKRKFNTKGLKPVTLDTAQNMSKTSTTNFDKLTEKLTRTQRRNRNRRLKRQEESRLHDKEKVKDNINQFEFPVFDQTPAEVYPVLGTMDLEPVDEDPIERTTYTPVPYDPSLDLTILEMNKDERNISEEELRRIWSIQKHSFEQFKHINGSTINILEGVKLFTRVFDEDEQAAIIEHVMEARSMGRAGRLRSRTYSEPNKWIRGKGRLTIQYGCCYNYAFDKEGNPPGILRYEQVDPLPTVIIQIIRRLVTWGIMPSTCIPDSCIINIYDEGDCIPPHIDSHDFERPFCTLSLMNRCSILFGREIQILGPGEFSGTYQIPLPRGSVLLLQDNGADMVKHCIPSVGRRRISITLRRMRPDKRPIGYQAIRELEGLKPLELPGPRKYPDT